MSSTPVLSVVIPTRNRRARLAETLDALAAEARTPDFETASFEVASFEVVVVDDGSTDDTVEFLQARAPHLPFDLRLLPQEPSGPAAARNRGVAEARAAFVLFLGDDTKPTPGTLAKHLETLTSNDSGDRDRAVQGLIDWDPEQEITPLMDFLAPAGPQFYFRGLEHLEEIPYTAVLGSNLSAPTEWLRREPFDEGFPYAAMEDTEMAWRWRRHGWRVIYREDAVCLHHHRYDDLDAFLDRQRRAGASARYAVSRHPRLLWPLALQPTLFGAWIPLRRLLGRGRPTDPWDLACRKAFAAGFLRGPRD